MTGHESFGIAAFRSRQQVMRFDSALRRAGIHSEIVSTPKDVSVGCGLSVAFDPRDAAAVMDIYQRLLKLTKWPLKHRDYYLLLHSLHKLHRLNQAILVQIVLQYNLQKLRLSQSLLIGKICTNR